MRTSIPSLFLIASIILNGCAIYDPKRGIFVSSTVQTVPLDIKSDIKDISIMPFSYPKQELSDTQSTTIMVSGTFMPISHTYVYDEVDKQYLKESLINSLGSAGIKVTDHSDNKLYIDFTQIGMASKDTMSILVLVADVKLKKPADEDSKTISVKGEAKATVASTKDQAVRVFLNEIALFLTEITNKPH